MDLNEILRSYINQFNADDDETVINYISNADSYEWLLANAPLISIPDKEIERAYYFRLWTYRKHICQTPEGFVLNEFNTREPVSWAYKYNTISCASGHHIDEGRWFRDNSFLDSYIRHWYNADLAEFNKYTNWLTTAVAGLCKLRGDWTIAVELLDKMITAFTYVETTQQHISGAYYAVDDSDGGEFSVGGSGIRPNLNCYAYGNALSIAEIAEVAGKTEIAIEYIKKAEKLKSACESILWVEKDRFYKTFAVDDRFTPIPSKRSPHTDAREIVGYLPWLFHMAPVGREDSFRQLFDEKGFFGKTTATTCERRSSDFLVTYSIKEFNDWLRRYDRPPYGYGFNVSSDYEFRCKKLKGDWLYTNLDGTPGIHECQWNGPSYAYSTSQMLGSVAALLIDYPKQNAVSIDDYQLLLHRYAASQTRVTEDGRRVSWTDEAQDPDTGEWITRSLFYREQAENPDRKYDYIDRGKDYNHSTYCDLILSGMFGIRPGTRSVKIAPLFPASWPYAHLKGIKLHGASLDIDYIRGKGYTVRINGDAVFTSFVPENSDVLTDK